MADIPRHVGLEDYCAPDFQLALRVQAISHHQEQQIRPHSSHLVRASSQAINLRIASATN